VRLLVSGSSSSEMSQVGVLLVWYDVNAVWGGAGGGGYGVNVATVCEELFVCVGRAVLLCC